MTLTNDATSVATPSTETSAMPRPPKEWPANRLAARTALQVAERRKAAKRDDLYREIAVRVLHEARHSLTTEEDLYVACYQALRAQGRTLWTADCYQLRAATRQAWSAYDPGESQLPGGIEEAATAAAGSDSDSPARDGSTAAVSGTPDGRGRAGAPVVGAGDRPDYFALGCAIARAQHQTLSETVIR